MPRKTESIDVAQLNNLSATLLTRFVWVMRDFSEDLVDESGERIISENEYFETRLSDFAKSSHRKFKQIREALLAFFPDREMVTMAAPSTQKSELKNIMDIALDDLTEDF